MAKHNEVGEIGEAIALDFLQLKGYELLEKNWRFRKAEIDLIFKDKDILVFVEVKTRSSVVFGRPEEFITEKKQDMMGRAAAVYMEKIGHTWAVRFDVVAIILHKDNTHEVEHFEDAFF